jgi:hypothetical protein
MSPLFFFACQWLDWSSCLHTYLDWNGSKQPFFSLSLSFFPQKQIDASSPSKRTIPRPCQLLDLGEVGSLFFVPG